MRNLLFCAVSSLSLAGCSTAQLASLQTGSTNFQSGIAIINADIAATAPVVAQNCGALQTIAGLLVQVSAGSKKAGPAFAAANASIVAWCQQVPTDVASAATATAASVVAAQKAYQAVKAGG
jgi:hypothetical protein